VWREDKVINDDFSGGSLNARFARRLGNDARTGSIRESAGHFSKVYTPMLIG
jgi:hypothetical protein